MMRRTNKLLFFVMLMSGCANSFDEIDFSQVNSEDVYGTSKSYHTIRYDGVSSGQGDFRQVNFSVINPLGFDLCIPVYHQEGVFGEINYFDSEGRSLRDLAGSESPSFRVPLGNPIATQQTEFFRLHKGQTLQIIRNIQFGMFRRYPDGFDEYEIFQSNGPYFAELKIDGVISCSVDGYENPMDSHSYGQILRNGSIQFLSARSGPFYLNE